MYVQITTRCNMSCAHCGFSCTEVGEDMSFEVFRAALGCDEHIEIGGGEPTIHPMFWQFLGEALGNVEYVWLATNGSISEVAIPVAKMAEGGILGAALSTDPYHDPINPEVVEAFSSDTFSKEDQRELRDVYTYEVMGGRCDWGVERCICESSIVKPDGSVYQCGCEDAPLIGHVLGEDNFDISGGCHNENTEPF
jgi:hypothetical protein